VREQAAAAARSIGGEPVWGDLSTQTGVIETADRAAELAPALHVLVHNAGVGSPGTLEDHTRAQFDHVMAVNAAAPLFLTQLLLGPLRAADPAARVVVISSDSGQFSVPKNGVAFPYRMSKAAVNMLTLNLAAALAGDGIAVNAMHPGWLRTDMGAPDAPVAPEQAAETALHLATLPNSGPSGRLWHDKALIDW
jgi:NAD(P)-dependent dehydrogenase (short-subunit alcohol dehydrogenase family)